MTNQRGSSQTDHGSSPAEFNYTAFNYTAALWVRGCSRRYWSTSRVMP